jgi:hypothetical protein
VEKENFARSVGKWEGAGRLDAKAKNRGFQKRAAGGF